MSKIIQKDNENNPFLSITLYADITDKDTSLQASMGTSPEFQKSIVEFLAAEMPKISRGEITTFQLLQDASLIAQTANELVSVAWLLAQVNPNPITNIMANILRKRDRGEL